MDIVSNIVGVVVLIALLLGAWFVISSGQLSELEDKFERAKQEFNAEKLSSDFDSILKVTEARSSQPLALIIADAVYYRKNSLDYGSGAKIDAESVLEEVLNKAYGEKRYFLAVVKDSLTEDANRSSSYYFSVGEEKNLGHYSFERALPLPNNVHVKVKLVVYEN